MYRDHGHPPVNNPRASLAPDSKRLQLQLAPLIYMKINNILMIAWVHGEAP